MLGNEPAWFGGGPHGKGFPTRGTPRRAAYPVDGAAQGKHKIGRGNRWIIAGIVVRLPFCSSPVCLPVLFRLWRGKGTASHVDLAAELMKLIIDAFPGWRVHGVGDAAYHGKALVTPQATWTTRLPHNATLYALPPDRTGKPQGRVVKGRVLPSRPWGDVFGVVGPAGRLWAVVDRPW